MTRYNKMLPIAVSTAVALVFGFYFGLGSRSEDSISSTLRTGKCVVSGCSGQLCLDEDDATRMGVTTCEFSEEHACYKDAVCERQFEGFCGWTLSEEQQACLDNVQNDYLIKPVN